LRFREFSRIFWTISLLGACAKKAPPKPVHTEPWLAHPPASARASAAEGDAAVPTTRYVLTEQSRISLELPTKRGKVRGKLTHVTGQLDLALGALAQSHLEVHADLSSLALEGDADDNASAWFSRAQSALGSADGGAAIAPARFDLTGLSELSTEAIALSTADAAARPNARVRGVAEGDLLLNGFRVAKRAPFEAEFGFSRSSEAPSNVTIRSRAPLVLTLETHEIHLRDAPAHAAGSNAERRRERARAGAHELRLTFELYAIKP